jgi:hypothetical protein
MVPRRSNPLPLVVCAAAVPLLFAALTHHAWEDYYITLRASRNLVDGHGLVFQPGERLHTFTSPLGVLVPAFFTWIVGPGREDAALWLFRLLSAGLLGVTAWFAWRRFDDLKVGGLGRLLFFGLVLADPKLTDFATNGMETAILVGFVVWLWSEMERPAGPRSPAVAVGCAGLMWTRPDAFILGAAILLPHLAFRRRPDGSTRIPWAPVLRGIGLGALIYAPWLVWATWYYGTPVPHTITAKAALTPPIRWTDFAFMPWRTLIGTSLLPDLFLPTYWFYGQWPQLLKHVAHALSAVAAFAWVVPGLPPPARRASLAVFLGMFYVGMIILFPWYSPPWLILAALALALTVDHVAGIATRTGRAWLASTLRVAVGSVVCLQVLVLAAATWQMRVQQRIVENGVRREIGLWLRREAAPGDIVFMECLGYIGYFSQLKTYDFPGLSSPEVVRTVRAGARRYTEVIAALRPNWLVLRPHELADPSRPENAALRDYQLVRTWDRRAELDAIPFLPGRGWLEHDSRFFVLRRIR